MAKYNVGDKVRVRSDLKFGQKYGSDVFVRGMEVMLGKEAHIASIRDISGIKYTIHECSYNWTDEMFEDEPICEPISLDISCLL